MEKAAIILQRWILLRRLYVQVAKNIELFDLLTSLITVHRNHPAFDPTKTLDRRYTEMQQILGMAQHIAKADQFVAALYRHGGIDESVAPRINGRKLLIAWVIVAFPEYTLNIAKPDTYKDEYPIDIYFMARKMIDLLHGLAFDRTLEALRKFRKAFNIYSNAVVYFLERDKHMHIGKLIDEYIGINRTIIAIRKSNKYTPQEKDASIATITTTKNRVIAFLNRMDNTITGLHLEILFEIHELVEIQMQHALHDILVNDINTKNLNYVELLLNEMTADLITHGGRQLDAKFDENIDTANLIHLIAYGSATCAQVAVYGDHFTAILIKLHSSKSTNEINAAWRAIRAETNLSQMMAKMIIFFFNRLKQW